MEANGRVLVIEDDDDIRDVIEEVLAAEGLQVDVAKDGMEALHKLEANGKPPVILLDMMMPRMDGETFLEHLRRNPEMADAAVVVISGNAAARDKAHQLSAAACLVKPFELDELLAVIHRLTHSDTHH